MLLGHDVVADRDPQAGALAGRLRCKERLEQFVFDLRRNAVPLSRMLISTASPRSSDHGFLAGRIFSAQN
jgi:hypothetical protein